MAVLPLPLHVSLTGIVWNLAPATSVGMALNSANQRLKEAQIESAFLDAQVILACVLGVDRPWLFAHSEVELDAKQAEVFTELIARRMNHEPVAYLVGAREFYGLELYVDGRVLIPRPETEMLVDEVLAELESRGESEVRIADVGTGSGAIALAIAANDERARIYALDVSRKALAVAKINVQKHDTRRQVILLRGDLLEPLPKKVDIIVANLPYIAAEAYAGLDATVKEYEPRLALESGVDGLDAIARLLRHAAEHLNPGGMIYLEIGYDQGAALRALAANVLPHARAVAVHQDYQGHDRMVVIAV